MSGQSWHALKGSSVSHSKISRLACLRLSLACTCAFCNKCYFSDICCKLYFIHLIFVANMAYKNTLTTRFPKLQHFSHVAYSGPCLHCMWSCPKHCPPQHSAGFTIFIFLFCRAGDTSIMTSLVIASTQLPSGPRLSLET